MAVSCRYLQQLIDHECETAKENGTYEKGVLFLEGNVKEVERNVVWRNPQAGGGEVRFQDSCTSRSSLRCNRSWYQVTTVFRGWDTLQTELEGRKHVFCGADDHVYTCDGYRADIRGCSGDHQEQQGAA